MFNSAYSERKRIAKRFLGKSCTHQSFKDTCDINLIMARYKKTGLIDHVNTLSQRYGDFSDIGDYQDSLNRIIVASDTFSALPATVRKFFDNDPSQMLAFCSNPDNHEKMVELGLAKPTLPLNAPDGAPQAPIQKAGEEAAPSDA